MKHKRLLALLGSLTILAPTAPTVSAWSSWNTYYSTAQPQPTWPMVYASSTTHDQTIEDADITACSGGSWTQYLNVEIAATVVYTYQGGACLWINYGPPIIAARSVCSSMTGGGNNYMNCLRGNP
jgi:hypothetical protein